MKTRARRSEGATLLRVLRKVCAIGLAFTLIGPTIGLALDTMTLPSGDTVEGYVSGFEKGQFSFTAAGGKTTKHRAWSVKKIAIDPPTRVTLQVQGRKDPLDAILRGYEDNAFVAEFNGRDESIPYGKVKEMAMSMDMARTFDAGARRQTASTFDVTNYVSRGMVTVIHFHLESVLSSVRQGLYVEALARDSNGKMKAVKIDLKDWNSPVALQYGIKSVPQFWFYNRRGKLCKKLTDRFTEGDILSAIKEAQR